MREYVLTGGLLRGLATGGGSAEAVDLLVDAQLSRRRLLLVAAAEQARRMPPELGEALALIARIDRTAPAAGRELLRYPFLGAWFAGLASAADEAGRDVAAGRLGALAASAAVAARVPFRLDVPTATPDLVLPGLGVAVGVGPGRVPLRFDGGATVRVGAVRVGVPGAGAPATPARGSAPGWRPEPRVDLPGLCLAVIDADPLRDRFSAPALAPLEPVGMHAFERTVAAAWRLLRTEQPAHARAMRGGLRAIVPLRAPTDGTQVSASVRGCFGAVGMSPTDDPVLLAELLVHEFQHEKLNALLDLVDLCADDGPARFHAPWRPDPRPAAAVMQGVYAFAGVAGFWRVHRRDLTGDARRHAESRYALLSEHVRGALAELRGSGELTGLGARFFGELAATVEAWGADSPAADDARRQAAADEAAWRRTHRPPPAAEAPTAGPAGAGPADGSGGTRAAGRQTAKGATS
ncbi:HEXXH motif domain-containing protein [Mangrovihabitans endophyticus]|uniref:HEXXH motif domain-containing protein n=1 Tax=Mangrovihabitans endophyticus TaxID=1751298 RepID=A0A8J3BVX9_9ACTN|nr:HEXXH motif domain-containing protein [Mangrovihabitans endophyticus]GGK72223.1 HEXXH motif domain-containing protein [Mangrovihabitans endophyticus]